ncbi:MAG: aminotransferase class III-fold pyridoxal phosphate-dependent enzyme, partial [Methanobacteriota archaeon]
RAATRRPRIVKVHGGFHGSHDAVLVAAGSGALTHGVPDSEGVLPETAARTTVVPFNDAERVRAELRARDVAAVLVEPVLGNVGVIPPAPGYLRALREACDETDTLLLFDEIITGLRLALGGAAERYGVSADLTTLGKVLGGGLPLAAFGGRSDLMAQVAPEGKVYQAGTFSGNPLSVAAGLATLEALTPAVYASIDRTAERVANGLEAAAAKAGIPVVVNRVGSMWTPFFARGPVTDYASARTSDVPRFSRFFAEMLARGVYLPPSQFEAWFSSFAHGGPEVEETLGAAEEAFRRCASG